MWVFYQQPGLGDAYSFGQILFSLRIAFHASKVDGNCTLNGITQSFRGRLHRTLRSRVYFSEWGSQERWKSVLRATLFRFTGGAPDQPVSYNAFTMRAICRSDKQLANVRYRTVRLNEFTAPPHSADSLALRGCPSPSSSTTIRTFPSALESRAPPPLLAACSQSPAFPIQTASG